MKDIQFEQTRIAIVETKTFEKARKGKQLINLKIRWPSAITKLLSCLKKLRAFQNRTAKGILNITSSGENTRYARKVTPCNLNVFIARRRTRPCCHIQNVCRKTAHFIVIISTLTDKA